MYVYTITNKINNKKYIGITNNYKKRWQNECYYNKQNEKKNQLIQKKIHQYGKENFIFEIIASGLSIQEAVKLEYDLIGKYHTWVGDPFCQGYNVDRGGETYPQSQPQKGEKNGRSKLTDEEAQYILDNRNQPEYVLFDDFSNKISYDEFKQIYLNKKFKHLTTNTEIYPFNFEFSCQFNKSKLDYGDIVELRQAYANGIYWRDKYMEYQNLYPNEWDFWNIYNGNRYSLVMPEVFTTERKHYHSSLSKSGSKNGRAKLTEIDVKTIRELKAEGKTLKEIYSLYPHISTTSIRNVINYKTWKNIL